MTATSSSSDRKLKSLPPKDRLLYWMIERERVRKAKEAGEPAPWTADPILATYRFTNVRRMDDKVSRWLMTNWYEPFFNHRNMLAAVALARFVNKPESLGLITRSLFNKDKGGPGWEDVKHFLTQRRESGETVFNGAYMVRGNSKVTKDKVKIVVDEYVRPLWDAHVKHPPSYVVGNSMATTHAAISCQYGFGSFMAGQVVADLRWAVAGDWDDKDSWAPMGPGSQRGLNRILGIGDLRHQWKQWEFTAQLRSLMEWLKKNLPQNVHERLEAMDYQNCLCEFDKYERALWEEGRPKQLYKGGK